MDIKYRNTNKKVKEYIEELEEDDVVTVKELKEKLGKGVNRVKSAVHNLEKRGVLASKGSGRGKRWIKQ